MRFLSLILLLSIGCQQFRAGPSYIDRGLSTEYSAFQAADGTPIGMRLSVGYVEMPREWKEDWTMRYAVGPYLQIPLPLNFYLEPRFEVAYYPSLGTPFEPEGGARIGWSYKNLQIFGGVRFPFGNGNDHEKLNPPEYEHIYAGVKPEFGFSWSFDW